MKMALPGGEVGESMDEVVVEETACWAEEGRDVFSGAVSSQ